MFINSTAEPRAATPPTVRRGLVLAVASLCQLMVVLDITVVNVALPSIQADLGFHGTGLQWVVNAYTLTFGGLLLLGGRLADLLGHRRAALTGMVVFGLASLLAGLTASPWQLDTARAVQGVGAAFLLPVSLTLITVTFAEGAERRRALMVWSMVAGVGGAAGVILSGVLTEYLDWRWVFFVNVPIVMVAIGLVLVAVRDIRHERRRLDVPGAVLVTVAMLTLVYAVVGTDQRPWGSAATLVPLVAAVVLGAAFVWYELHVASAPLVRFGIFRSRPLLVADLSIMLISAGQLASFYFASLYLQGVLGYSALETGLAFVPLSLAIILGSLLATRLLARFGPGTPLLIGLLLTAGALLWFGQADADGSFTGDILGPSLPAGVGLGMCFVCVASGATTGVRKDEAGLASGLLNASRQSGGAIGLAVLVTIATAVTATHRDPSTSTALTHGYDVGFRLAGGLLLVAAVLVWIFLRPAGRGELASRSSGRGARS